MKLNIIIDSSWFISSVISALLFLTFSACSDQTNPEKNANDSNNSIVASSGQSSTSETPTPSSTATPTTEPGLPEFKVGEDYKTSVRPKMLNAGWKYYRSPDAQKCGSSDPTCDEYPEMEACAGTGLGNCKFMWIKGDKLASIYTVDDPFVYQNSEVNDAPKEQKDSGLIGSYEFVNDHEFGRDTFKYDLKNDHVAIYSESREGGGIDDQRGDWKYDPERRNVSVHFGPDEYVFTLTERGLKLIKEPNEPKRGVKGFTGETFERK